MSVKIIISDILKKRHDKVTELEVVRRDIGGLGTTLENIPATRFLRSSDYKSVAGRNFSA